MANKVKRILVVDLEATCWENDTTKQNEIIEIGIVPIEISSQSILDGEGIIVRPTTTEISPFCTKLTTLTPEFVAENGISFREAIGRIKEKYDAQNMVWASWGAYDQKQVEAQCKREGVRYPFGNMHINVKALFAAQFGFSCGMDRALKHLELPLVGTHHRGIDDARNIAKILLLLLPED